MMALTLMQESALSSCVKVVESCVGGRGGVVAVYSGSSCLGGDDGRVMVFRRVHPEMKLFGSEHC